MKTYNDLFLFSILDKKVKENGLRTTARELGFSAPFLHDVLAARRGLSKRLGAALGFERMPDPKPSLVIHRWTRKEPSK